MGAPGPEQRKEPRYQVTYHTYLASGRRLSYTPSVERVVGLKYTKRTLLVLQNFTIFRLRHAHVRKDTRLSTAFPYCKRRKAGRDLGILLCYYNRANYLCAVTDIALTSGTSGAWLAGLVGWPLSFCTSYTH